ncbi:MAG: sugar phosphate isomerase/epimerase [Planctomycetota bacterium]|nr:sugar phosphate isomerase/epimerase [Planctomycetota bacterium]
MYVAASTSCFPDLPYDEALSKLNDLEFSYVELDIHEHGGHMKPSEVADDLERAVALCRQTYRMTLAAFSIDIDAEGDEYYRQFSAICRLAKATKVVVLCVRSGELGTPFNAEVERLRDLVGIATVEGIVVAVKTEIGRVTEDPDTIKVLCDNVQGLGVTLDPSHFVHGSSAVRSYDSVLKYTAHVQLRDTNKEQLQVRVGQGEVEYGRLVTQLSQLNYRRTLTVDVQPLPDTDQMGELRKMRLLLESLL